MKILRLFVLSVVFILRKIPHSSSIQLIYRRPHRFREISDNNSSNNQRKNENKVCIGANAYRIIHLEIHCDEEKNSVRSKK